MAVCEEIEKRGKRGLAAALRVAVRAATAGSHRTSPREACQQGEFSTHKRETPKLPCLTCLKRLQATTLRNNKVLVFNPWDHSSGSGPPFG